jgi:hypothetical protein
MPGMHSIRKRLEQVSIMNFNQMQRELDDSQDEKRPHMKQPTSGSLENGNADMASETLKRPKGAPLVGEGEKKRARRMFGSLLGTLASARKEDEATKQIACKRAEIQRKAEERQKEEAEKLSRDKARQLDIKKRIKRLEQEAAAKIESRKRQHTRGLILTSFLPGLYWRPSIESCESMALRQSQKEEIAKWSAGVMEALEVERQRLMTDDNSKNRPLDKRTDKVEANDNVEEVDKVQNAARPEADLADLNTTDDRPSTKCGDMDELLYG